MSLRSRWSLLALTLSIFLNSLCVSATLIAIPLRVAEEYGVGLELGLTLSVRLVPNILFGSLVGELIDRRNPVGIAIGSAILVAVATFAMPATTSLWQLQVLVAVSGIGSMFAGPARMALRNFLIPQDSIESGNSAVVTAERVPDVLGPAAAGAVYALFGASAVLFGCGLAAALSGVVLCGVHIRDKLDRSHVCADTIMPKARSVRWAWLSPHFWTTNPRAILRMMKTDAVLVALTLTTFGYLVSNGLTRIFLLALAAANFGSVPGGFGYLASAFGLGGVLGGLSGILLRRVRRRVDIRSGKSF